MKRADAYASLWFPLPGIAGEAFARTACAACDRPGVAGNGRYCRHCLVAAHQAVEEHSDDALDRALLDFIEAELRVRISARRPYWMTVDGEGRRPRVVAKVEATTAKREFERTDIDDEAMPVGPVNAKRFTAAVTTWDREAGHWAFRYPDGKGGLVFAGDLILVPLFSPHTFRWSVFKCERGTSTRGKSFVLVPLERVEVPDSVGIITYLGGETEVEDLHDNMEAAWAVANDWANELRSAWALDGVASMWDGTEYSALIDKRELAFTGKAGVRRDAQLDQRELTFTPEHMAVLQAAEQAVEYATTAVKRVSEE